jgi:DNA-directed RNA polymerase sigma subunit (sigma70/sigma32)
MNECTKKCILNKNECDRKDCRMWIDYRDDLNCALITVYNGKGPMTLEEVSKRFNLSIVRIKQIQDKALQKLKKNAPLLK